MFDACCCVVWIELASLLVVMLSRMVESVVRIAGPIHRPHRLIYLSN